MIKSQDIKIDITSKCLIQIKLINGSDTIDLKYKWITASKKKQELNSNTLHIIIDLFFKTETIHNQHQGIEMTNFTEFSHNNIIYRADPSYRNESAWYDWAMVAWSVPHWYTNSQIQEETFPKILLVSNTDGQSSGKKNKAMLTPAKLLAFIELENGDRFAIVQSCFEYWKKCLC